MDSSVGAALHSRARHDLADGTFAYAEGIVDADQRSSFRQAVSLDDREAQASPKFFGFAVKDGAAADEGPELPPELAMDTAESPPAAQEVLTSRSCEIFSKPGQTMGVFQVAFDFFFQRLEHTRDRDQDRDSPPPDRSNAPATLQGLLKNHVTRPNS